MDYERLGGLDAISRDRKAIYEPLQEPVSAAASHSHEHCRALPSTAPGDPKHDQSPASDTRTDGQMDSSTSASHRVGQARGHKAMVALECDMAQWKKKSLI